MRLYIAGPMAGLPEFNFPTFNAVEDALMKAGYEVVNPAALDVHEEWALEHSGDHATGTGVKDRQRAAFLKRDFHFLTKCDGIVMLNGWQSSTGANAELLVARIMDLDVFVWDDLDGLSPAPLLRPLVGPITHHLARLESERVGDLMEAS